MKNKNERKMYECKIMNRHGTCQSEKGRAPPPHRMEKEEFHQFHHSVSYLLLYF